jgi:uncharacterized membrane protein YfcA
VDRLRVTLLVVAVTVAFAAFLQSAAGFGYSLIAVPIISMIAGAKVAVVATTTLAFGLILSLAWSGRRHVCVSVVRVVTIAAVVGMPIGLWILTHVGDRVLAIVISLAVLLLTLILISGASAPDRPGIDVAGGFASGVLATSTGTNGPPLVMALHARRVPASEFRATLSAAFVLQDIVALLGFALTRRFSTDVWRIVLVGVPGVVTGRLVGERLFTSLDQRRFRAFALGLLLATGMFSLAQALFGGG